MKVLFKAALLLVIVSSIVALSGAELSGRAASARAAGIVSFENSFSQASVAVSFPQGAKIVPTFDAGVLSAAEKEIIPL